MATSTSTQASTAAASPASSARTRWATSASTATTRAATLAATRAPRAAACHGLVRRERGGPLRRLRRQRRRLFCRLQQRYGLVRRERRGYFRGCAYVCGVGLTHQFGENAGGCFGVTYAAASPARSARTRLRARLRRLPLGSLRRVRVSHARRVRRPCGLLRREPAGAVSSANRIPTGAAFNAHGYGGLAVYFGGNQQGLFRRQIACLPGRPSTRTYGGLQRAPMAAASRSTSARTRGD